MMDAKILTASEVEAIENSAIQRMYKRIPYVYAHGQLAEDMGTNQKNEQKFARGESNH